MLKLIRQIFGYLCHVNLVAGELTELDYWDVMGHQDVVIGTPLNDDLGLIGRRSNFISGFVVHGILQLPTIRCDLRTDAGEFTTMFC